MVACTLKPRPLEEKSKAPPDRAGSAFIFGPAAPRLPTTILHPSLLCSAKQEQRLGWSVEHLPEEVCACCWGK